MSLLVTLQDEMKTAMKARDQARVDALRFIISAIKYAMVDAPDLDDGGIVAVLTKEAKKRRESIVAYTSAGRTELADKEKYELAIIESYLPKMMSEEEVRAKVQALLQNNELRITNYGEAMKAVMKEVGGKAEGGVVAKVVKELLGK